MKIQDVQRDKEVKRTIPISIRSPANYCKFMKENLISPTKLFNKAVEELMKEKTNNDKPNKN